MLLTRPLAQVERAVVSQTLKKKAHQARSNHRKITGLRGIRHKLRNGTSHGRITDKINQTQKPQV